MRCANWYAPTKQDQCDLPSEVNPALTKDGQPLDPIVGFKAYRTTSVYGKPSELNRNNDCPNYKPAGLVLILARKFFFDVPLRPTVNKAALTDRVE